jgi:hypothetical protein
MLFTWDTTDLCIVFRGWRITGTGSLIVSLLAIILLTAGYEAVREASRRYEAYAAGVGERRDGVGRGELDRFLWNIMESAGWDQFADKHERLELHCFNLERRVLLPAG